MIRQTALVVLLTYILAFTEASAKGHCSTEHPVVTTPLGQIQGSTLTSRLGKTIYAFRGIRYAKPPVDELRFQPPVPMDKWEGIYNATEDGPLCPQPTTYPISEDCLILNVYSTKLPDSSKNPKRPVIVHIHPGGFYGSTSVSYWAGPQYFMDQDIVLVTFNYRLGSLGFLSTGDEEAPGNNGLKDQVVLLKWVKQNIEAFGGDPESVTILGYSAGAWSVILHMVSPMSQDLFHKGVSMSGSPVGCWPLPYNQLEIAKKQARFVGCPDDTAANIIKCLKTKSYKELADSLPKFREFGFDPVLIWSPVIEEDFGQQRFLSDPPIELIQRGKLKSVPFMTGITTDEFGYKALSVVNNQTLTDEINKDFEKIAPISFIYESGTEHSKNVSKELKKFYFNDKPIDKSQLTSLDHAYADSIEGFPVNRAAKLIAQYSKDPVYYYHFSYQGRYSHVYLPDTNDTVPYGVVHHDDLIYLFYISKLFPYFNSSFPEVEMVEKLTTIYANFAKTGNPIPTPSEKLDNVRWEPFTLEDEKYMDIGNKLVMHAKLHDERYMFWEKLYPLNQSSEHTKSHKSTVHASKIGRKY